MAALDHVTATFADGIAEEAPRGLEVSQGSTAGAGVLLVRARVTAVHPGSEAARHFGGLGGVIGGAASVAIAGEVVDGKTKKVLFTFAQERRSGANSGGSSASARAATTTPTPASSTGARSKSATTSATR